MPNYFESMGKPRRDGKPRKATPSPSHKRAVKQEKEAALRFGGSAIARSGAGDIKGDVRVKGKIRIECKTTKHASFSVTLDTLRKVEEAALSGAEIPVLIVGFNTPEGNPLGEVAVIPRYLLDELMSRWE